MNDSNDEKKSYISLSEQDEYYNSELAETKKYFNRLKTYGNIIYFLKISLATGGIFCLFYLVV